MQTGTGKARSDRTDLEISRLALPSEGPTPENTGYMTPTEFRTAGGFLAMRTRYWSSWRSIGQKTFDF